MNRRERATGFEMFLSCAALLVPLGVMIGGLGNLVHSLVSAIGVIAAFGVIALSMHSPLVLLKRVGISILTVGVSAIALWAVLKAPPEWPAVQATVISVKPPTVVEQSDYLYSVDGRDHIVTKDNAGGLKRSLFLYVNPRSADAPSEQPRDGWIRVEAKRVGGRKVPKDEYVAVLGFGPFAGGPVTITGPAVQRMTVGRAVTVWRNPVNASEISLAPRMTVGGQKLPLFAAGVLSCLVGCGLLATGKQWVDPTRKSARGDDAPSFNTPTVADQLSRIDWYQFEKVVERILRMQGWTTQRRGGAHPDGGADLVAERGPQHAVVQCKYWDSGQVPVRVVRELIGTRASAEFQGCNHAMLFSTCDLSVDAQTLARDNGIQVVLRADIERDIAALGIANFCELMQPDDKRCPKCDGPMIWRASPNRPFWGCSTFPRCTGKIESRRADVW